MKKLLVVVIIFIILLVVGIWSPWLDWNFSLARIIGLGSKESRSGLNVYSLVGETEVYLDNSYQGKSSPEDGNLEIYDVSPGKHKVRIKRLGQPDNAYYELNRDIVFEEGIDVIISYELGPTRDFSEGHIFYAQKAFNSSQFPVLNVISNPENAKLYIDDIFKGQTPISNLEIDVTKNYKIKLEAEGYDTIEFTILPESQEERDKLKGYILNLEINMFLKPLNVIDEGE